MKIFLIILCLLSAAPVSAAASEYVVLLHGLARTSRSLHAMEIYLAARGYRVLNISYPSRKHPIPELAAMIRKQVLMQTSGASRVHFVTHSMGGIILRYIQKHDPLPEMGRAVMLSPPNHGSQVVDKLGKTWMFRYINGPAGAQLGTGRNGFCQSLGPAGFELGVITGDRSINWINSALIPGKDDGKVSLESAKVEGMADYLVVHAAHPFIMQDKAVFAQCHAFLRTGHFKRGQADCLLVPVRQGIIFRGLALAWTAPPGSCAND